MAATRDNTAPVISADADRVLGRIIVRYGAVTFALLVAASFGMAFVNLPVPQNLLFRWHKPLDMVSILIVLVPFFLGMNRLFAARLRLGRDFVQRRQWTAAIAALDPFAGPEPAVPGRHRRGPLPARPRLRRGGRRRQGRAGAGVPAPPPARPLGEQTEGRRPGVPPARHQRPQTAGKIHPPGER